MKMFAILLSLGMQLAASAIDEAVMPGEQRIVVMHASNERNSMEPLLEEHSRKIMLDSKGRKFTCHLPAWPSGPRAVEELAPQEDSFPPCLEPTDLLDQLKSLCFYRCARRRTA